METKTNMSKESKQKCRAIIHVAATASGAAGVAPIPIADTIPITTAQVIMIVSLGKVFNIEIKDSIARSLAQCGIAQTLGRNISKIILNNFPVIGQIANGFIATSLTEALGWKIADDFYKISKGEEPTNIITEDMIKEISELVVNKDVSKLIKKKK